MHNLRHPIITFIMAVLVVIGVGVGVLAATGNGALSPANIAPSVLATIAGEQAFSFSPALPATVPQVTASEAIASGASVPADVVAAELLEIRAPITKGKNTLVWAIQESLPGESEFVSSAPLSVGGKIKVARATYNFRVNVVSARSGRLVFAN